MIDGYKNLTYSDRLLSLNLGIREDYNDMVQITNISIYVTFQGKTMTPTMNDISFFFSNILFIILNGKTIISFQNYRSFF